MDPLVKPWTTTVGAYASHILLALSPAKALEIALRISVAEKRQRVKLCALPASTLTMLPVDFADISETRK